MSAFLSPAEQAVHLWDVGHGPSVCVCGLSLHSALGQPRGWMVWGLVGLVLWRALSAFPAPAPSQNTV